MTDTMRGANPPSRLTLFVRDRLAARDEHRFWLALSLGLGLVASIAFLRLAFSTPGSVQDDGRMFLSWMGRWDDPTLLAGDLVADFWFSVSPWFFRAVYYAAWSVGIEPLLFTKLLPALLYPLIALFSYRFLRAIGAEPLVAFVTTGFVLYMMVREDIVISGTPRAFWPMLLLATMDGLARKKAWQTALAQLAMTGTYPQMSLVMATVIGSTFVTPWRRPFLDLTAGRLVLVALSAAATIAGIVPFILASDGFGPTIALAEALRTPTFGVGGRGTIMTTDGRLDFVCGPRLGIFNGRCRTPFEPDILATVAVTLIGPAVLFWRMFRGRPGQIRSEFPFYVLAMSLAWFVLASLVLFRLHLPNRYTAGLTIIGVLTTPALVVEWIRDRPFPTWLVADRRGRAVMLGGTAAVLVSAVLIVANVDSTFRTPKNAALNDAVKALPQGDVVGGFVRDLDFSPALTGRSTLFNRELAIAYQMGYFRRIIARMESVKDVVITRDPGVLSDRLASLGIDHLVAERSDLRLGRVPNTFRGFFPQTLMEEERRAAADGASPLVEQFAERCTSGTYGEIVMLSAECLRTEAERQTPR